MKKFLIFSFLPWLLMFVPSTANAMYCSRPSEPDIPTGWSADYDEMQNAKSEVDDYSTEMQDYVDCLNREKQDAIDEHNRVLDDWESAVSTFNNNRE